MSSPVGPSFLQTIRALPALPRTRRSSDHAQEQQAAPTALVALHELAVAGEQASLTRGASRTAATALEPPFTLRKAMTNRWAVAGCAVDFMQTAAYRLPQAVLLPLAKHCTTRSAQLMWFSSLVGLGAVVPRVAPTLSIYVMGRWEASLFAQREAPLMRAVANRPALWPNHELREFYENELSRQGLAAARHYINLGLSTASFVTSTAFDLWNIYTLFNPARLGGMVAIGAISFLLDRYLPATNLAGRKESRLASEQLQTRAKSFWDNMVLGNRANALVWQQDFDEASQRYMREKTNARFGMSIYHMLQSLPSQFFWQLQSADQMYQTVFPREKSFFAENTLSNLQTGLSIYRNVSSIRNIYQNYRDTREMEAERHLRLRKMIAQDNLRQRIHEDDIVVSSTRSETIVRPLLQNIEQFCTPGIYTIRGANGAGKTSLLLLCKEHFDTDALYIPPSSLLNFNTQPGSMGEHTRRTLAAVDQMSDRPKVILLDEWDAHLDDERRQDLLTLIEGWAHTHAVIQIVHRR